MSRVRTCLAIAGMSLLLMSALKGQVAQSNTTTLKSSSELVLIPTVVNDKSGAHIPGIKKEEFVLKQDGKPQPIAVFEEVNVHSGLVRRAEGEHSSFSNFAPASSEYYRLSIIVLDFVNTPFPDQANARNELTKFLSQVAESSEPMCLLALTRDGLLLIHDFTDDPKLLAAALRQAGSNNAPLIHEPLTEAGEFPGGGSLGLLARIIRANLEGEARMAALESDQAAKVTVQAMEQIARAFRGLPGRKSLIWASSGFPFSASSPSDGDLWKTMNDAQIAIYSVDLRAASTGNAQQPGGVRPSDLGDPQFDTDGEARLKRQDEGNTLRLFAENTGGKAFLGGANLAESFREATQDDSSYYMLGFYVNRTSRPGWHPISVAISRKGVHPRYRTGFLLSRDTSTASARSEMQLAIASPLDVVGLPVSISWSGMAAGSSPGKTKVQFDLVMPPNFTSIDHSDQNHMVLDIAAVARNLKGEVITDLAQRIDTHLKSDGLEKIQTSGMTYRSGLQLPPGDYVVRFVVRDSLGDRMGSVAAPIKVSPFDAKAN